MIDFFALPGPFAVVFSGEVAAAHIVETPDEVLRLLLDDQGGGLAETSSEIDVREALNDPDLWQFDDNWENFAWDFSLTELTDVQVFRISPSPLAVNPASFGPAFEGYISPDEPNHALQMTPGPDGNIHVVNDWTVAPTDKTDEGAISKSAQDLALRQEKIVLDKLFPEHREELGRLAHEARDAAIKAAAGSGLQPWEDVPDFWKETYRRQGEAIYRRFLEDHAAEIVKEARAKSVEDLAEIDAMTSFIGRTDDEVEIEDGSWIGEGDVIVARSGDKEEPIEIVQVLVEGDIWTLEGRRIPEASEAEDDLRPLTEDEQKAAEAVERTFDPMQRLRADAIVEDDDRR